MSPTFRPSITGRANVVDDHDNITGLDAGGNDAEQVRWNCGLGLRRFPSEPLAPPAAYPKKIFACVPEFT
jgi:hypothetical protein